MSDVGVREANSKELKELLAVVGFTFDLTTPDSLEVTADSIVAGGAAVCALLTQALSIVVLACGFPTEKAKEAVARSIDAAAGVGDKGIDGYRHLLLEGARRAARHKALRRAEDQVEAMLRPPAKR